MTSPVAGTITELLAQVDENVEVGKPLFTLDDALTDSSSRQSAPTVTAASSEPAPALATVTAAASSGRRVPLIEFLGKRSLLPTKPSPSLSSKPMELELSPSLSPAVSVEPSSANVLPFTSAKRLVLLPAEVEAINSGLAFL